MRTPNANCCICGKSLYRRPGELVHVRYVVCMEHRNEAQANAGMTEAQLYALMLGSQKGTNHLKGIPKSEESKRKRSAAMKLWCISNSEKVKARAAKTRGINHYRWKGGASRLNIAIRQLTEYRKWINAVVWRDGACQKCGVDIDLEAHHVKPLAEIVSEYGVRTREQARSCLVLGDLANGITLCERCHCDYHNRAYTPTGNGRRKKPRRVRRSMAGELNPNYKGGKVAMTCPRCGTVFHVKPAEVNKRKYCSRRCLGESQRKYV